LIARMYAHEYPKEVAGMVLVDSAHEDEYLWINGKIVRPRFMTDQEWTDLIKPRKPAPDSKQPPPPPRPVPTKLDSPYDKLPPEAQRLRLWAMSIPWRNGGGDSEDMRQDFIAMHNFGAGSEHPLGKIPLVVLSKTPGADEDDDYTPDQLKWNRDLQDQLATLSTNSQHVVAPHSGHHIQMEEPDIVIAAIRRVVDSVRSQQPLTIQNVNLPPNCTMRGGSKSVTAPKRELVMFVSMLR
jgi:pimeloyl-ACP methyl ester carboxylesterase